MRTAILVAGLYIGDCLKTKSMMMDNSTASFYVVLIIIFFIMDVLEFTRGAK